MDIVVAILIFIGVLLVSALVFGGWVVVAIVRLMARALGGGGRCDAPPRRLDSPRRGNPCAYVNCRATNAPSARFCRRCGRPVGPGTVQRQAAVVRRVAMW